MPLSNPVLALHADVAARRAAVSAALAEAAVDAIVIASESNFTYLTGYQTGSWANKTFPLYLCMVAGERPVAVVGAGELDSISLDGGDLDIVAYSRPQQVGALAQAELDFMPHAAALLADILRRAGARRVGIEQSMPYGPRLAGRLVADLAAISPEMDLVDVAPLIAGFRRHKSPYEIERMREAAEVLGAAYDRFAERIRVGMTERELRRVFVGAACDAGADRVGYVGAIADARRASLGGPTDRTWDVGNLLMFDACLEVDGYWADFCRIYGARRVSPEQADAYTTLAEVVHAARRRIGPGVAIAEVAGELVGGGEGSLYGRSGHGIGLDYTEPPSIHVEEPALAEVGMVLCLEPNRSVAGVGNLTAEEEVLITEDGATLLSPPFPEEMHIVD
jgi:Xaa-Pro dipeptidase